MTFRLNKLVRAKLVDLYRQQSQVPSYRLLDQQELKKALLMKLVEEVHELSKENLVEELADIEQVLDDIKVAYKIDNNEIKAAKQAKLTHKGGFSEGVFIETIQLQDDDKWVAYYRASPELFEEIKTEY